MMLKSYEIIHNNMVHKVTSIVLADDFYIKFSMFNNFIDIILFNREDYYSIMRLELEGQNSNISNI